MQTPTDLARLMGRYSMVQTTSGEVGGTIVAAGVNGVSLAVGSEVRNFAPGEILDIQPRV